jgi:hypothetical protein
MKSLYFRRFDEEYGMTSTTKPDEAVRQLELPLKFKTYQQGHRRPSGGRRTIAHGSFLVGIVCWSVCRDWRKRCWFPVFRVFCIWDSSG